MDAISRFDDTYTVQDIINLPDGKRAELIDGKIYMMAPPSRQHQRMVVQLSTTINNYIKSKGGKCEVDVAPFAVYLFDDDRNYVEPDVLVVCDPEKLDDKGCHGAPDWIIEIVSPASVQMDYMIKLFKYEKAGVREYWIVDIERNRILVYDFANNIRAEYNLTETVKPMIYDDLEIDFSGISTE